MEIGLVLEGTNLKARSDMVKDPREASITQ